MEERFHRARRPRQGGRLVGRVLRVARVGHHHCRRLGKDVASKARDPVRADGGRHSGAGRAAPQGIALGADAEHLRVSEHVRDRRSEIARGDRAARPRTVSQHEGVVSLLADRHGIGEAFVDGADIGKASTRGDDRKGRSGLARERRTGPCSTLPAAPPSRRPCRTRRRRSCRCSHRRSCDSTRRPPSRDPRGCDTAAVNRHCAAACCRRRCGHPTARADGRSRRMPDGSGDPGSCRRRSSARPCFCLPALARSRP